VRIFDSANGAAAAGFRPCKRCKPDGLRLPDEEWVEAITEAIRAQYAERVTLASLADQQHVSQFHLQRTFKRYTGLSPGEYLLRIRMDAAMAFLRGSSLPVAEIGAQVGIPNAAHFATVFHKAAGCTPSRYRQAYEDKQAYNDRKAGETHD
jgi:AraC family transcriptional regulator, regulatory protein of adaptative response / methylphosphotriester-DNA alkyltransferase methyltransferase